MPLRSIGGTTGVAIPRASGSADIIIAAPAAAIGLVWFAAHAAADYLAEAGGSGSRNANPTAVLE